MKYLKIFGLLIFVFFLLLFLNFFSLSLLQKWENFSTKEEQKQNLVFKNSTLYRVDRVVDGDTVILKKSGERFRVRLVGINSPESAKSEASGRRRECFGDEASQYAKKLLEKKQVYFRRNEGIANDKYGRYLGFIYFQDGRDFGEEMIKNGYAYEYTYKGGKYLNQKKYKEAEKYARKNKVGLWAENACIDFER